MADVKSICQLLLCQAPLLSQLPDRRPDFCTIHIVHLRPHYTGRHASAQSTQRRHPFTRLANLVCKML